jgi:hypothetical protein
MGTRAESFQALSTGSIPVARFESDPDTLKGERGVAQSGSAFGWGPNGRWFKSSRPDLPIESAGASPADK